MYIWFTRLCQPLICYSPASLYSARCSAEKLYMQHAEPILHLRLFKLCSLCSAVSVVVLALPHFLFCMLICCNLAILDSDIC